MEKIKVYLVARVSKDAHTWNNQVTSSFGQTKFELFVPHKDNPWDDDKVRHEEVSQLIVDIDVKAINDSHFGLALPSFGRDCAWECGYYSKSKKPLVFFVDDQIEWLRDWMIKGGLDCVVTKNEKTYQIFQKDPILKYKSLFLIKEIAELNQIFLNLYKKKYGKT
jgi:nucleoside 2-deoxyribosyltransferase